MSERISQSQSKVSVKKNNKNVGKTYQKTNSQTNSGKNPQAKQRNDAQKAPNAKLREDKKVNLSKPFSSQQNQKSQKESREEEFDIPIVRELICLAVITLLILIFVSCFVNYESAMYWLKQIQLGLFGGMGYVIPVIAIGVVIWIYFKGWKFKNKIKVISIVVMSILLCSMFQMYSKEGFSSSNSILYYFVTSQNGSGGGLIGCLLLKILYPVLGTLGCMIVFFFFMIGVMMILTEKSFMEFIKYCMYEVKNMIILLKQSELRNEKILNKPKLELVHKSEKKISEENKSNQVENRKKVEFKIEHMDDYDEDREDVSIKKEMKPSLRERIKQLIHFEDEWQDEECDEDDEYNDKEKNQTFIEKLMLDDEEREFVKDTSSVKLISDTNVNLNKQQHSDSNGADKIALARENSWQKKLDEQNGGRKVSDEEQYKTVEFANGTTKTVVRDSVPGEKKVVKAAKKTSDEKKNRQMTLFDSKEIDYQLPSTDLLGKEKYTRRTSEMDQELQETAEKLQQVFDSFNVDVTITKVSCGPAVTRYELQPAQGVKVSRIVSLADDIKLNLAAADIRIEAPIPGKAAVGIEVPNRENSVVALRSLLEDKNFQNHNSKLAFAVGKDIGGNNLIADIAKMPHLLIAGATGSGKSVCINTILMSILYHAKPEEVRLIMIDPKVVELSVYNGIPHLLLPVVTDPKKAANALGWAVAEMTRRYQVFAEHSVRDMRGYNKKVEAGEILENGQLAAKMPQIVIIVDELADLMMVAPGDVEDSICRLAQMARAAGMHLIIATQRPSVNVITGVIKANIPSRIAFAVSSGVDSRTILDMNGAEKLLGKGDMLFYPSGYSKPVRVQGAFVSDYEVSQVVEFWSSQVTENHKKEREEVSQKIEESIREENHSASERDELFEQAGRLIIEKEKASIGMLQRAFKIGFNRAARLMDQLCEAGVVGEEEGTKPRKILLTMQEFEKLL
ncbi:MAG: DNA translocase FtsK [Lachnospiraceae bacterium]